MLYKFQNDWNKNSKWLLTKKVRQRICIWKGTKNLFVPKLYCNAEYWRLAKLMWIVKRKRQNYKQLESIYNLMHGLEQVPKGVMEKQDKGKWQQIQKYLIEFYIKLQQHFSTTILYCCLNTLQSSENLLQISQSWRCLVSLCISWNTNFNV